MKDSYFRLLIGIVVDLIKFLVGFSAIAWITLQVMKALEIWTA